VIYLAKDFAQIEPDQRSANKGTDRERRLVRNH
jgi:hypothetical protein